MRKIRYRLCERIEGDKWYNLGIHIARPPLPRVGDSINTRDGRFKVFDIDYPAVSACDKRIFKRKILKILPIVSVKCTKQMKSYYDRRENPKEEYGGGRPE